MKANPIHTNLLWVEDHGVTRQYIATVLSICFTALNVIFAADGAEGVELCRRHHPDLVVTDLDMPTMDGIGMVREIRKLGYLGEVIMITACTDPDLHSLLSDLGVDCCLEKPLLIKELVLAVAERLPQEDGAVHRWFADRRSDSRQESAAEAPWRRCGNRLSGSGIGGEEPRAAADQVPTAT